MNPIVIHLIHSAGFPAGIAAATIMAVVLIIAVVKWATNVELDPQKQAEWGKMTVVASILFLCCVAAMMGSFSMRAFCPVENG